MGFGYGKCFVSTIRLLHGDYLVLSWNSLFINQAEITKIPNILVNLTSF